MGISKLSAGWYCGFGLGLTKSSSQNCVLGGFLSSIIPFTNSPDYANIIFLITFKPINSFIFISMMFMACQFYFLLVSGCSFWDCGSRACHPSWKMFKGSRLSRLSDGARVGPLLCSPFLSYRLTSAASTTHDMTRS